MKKKTTILLDEPILGMDVYLRDLGWDILTVRETLGAGKSDDAVVDLAKERGYVVVTTDRKLAKRCRLLGIGLVELGVEDFARTVHQRLTSQISS